MIGYASEAHYGDHIAPLGYPITDRRPTGHTRVLVASRLDARRMEPV